MGQRSSGPLSLRGTEGPCKISLHTGGRQTFKEVFKQYNNIYADKNIYMF